MLCPLSKIGFVATALKVVLTSEVLCLFTKKVVATARPDGHLRNWYDVKNCPENH